MHDERRKYRRVAANVEVSFYSEKLSKRSQQYLKGLAENCSIGGVFIATDHSLAKGSIVRLKFQINSDPRNATVLYARAVVRWVRHWGNPPGIGVEFIEFEGLGDHQLALWLEMMFNKPFEPCEGSKPSQA